MQKKKPVERKSQQLTKSKINERLYNHDFKYDIFTDYP